VNRWLFLGLFATLAYADPPKIDLPKQPPEAASIEDPAASSEPLSTTISDAIDQDWKEYDNRIVKAHVRVNAAWTVMEFKETQDSGSVSFTLARAPGILVTFSITREPLDVPFEVWVSSSSLTPLYPSGYKESQTVLAGRKATLIKGTAPDGRFDESYFSAFGRFVNQVSFTAPKESWKDYDQAFAALKQSFRWLP
jgi:hypothetical protein